MKLSIFSERLKATRLTAKLTQQGLADMVEIPLRQYCRYEREEQEPTFPKVIALADALNVSLDYLAGRTDKPEINR